MWWRAGCRAQVSGQGTAHQLQGQAIKKEEMPDAMTCREAQGAKHRSVGKEYKFANRQWLLNSDKKRLNAWCDGVQGAEHRSVGKEASGFAASLLTDYFPF